MEFFRKMIEKSFSIMNFLIKKTDGVRYLLRISFMYLVVIGFVSVMFYEDILDRLDFDQETAIIVYLSLLSLTFSSVVFSYFLDYIYEPVQIYYKKRWGKMEPIDEIEELFMNRIYSSKLPKK